MAGHICSAANFIIQSVHGAEHKHTNTQTDRLGNAAICMKFTNSQEEITRERGRESILEVVVEDALVKSMRGGQKAARLQMRFIVNLLSVPKANIKRAARDTGWTKQ